MLPSDSDELFDMNVYSIWIPLTFRSYVKVKNLGDSRECEVAQNKPPPKKNWCPDVDESLYVAPPMSLSTTLVQALQ